MSHLPEHVPDAGPSDTTPADVDQAARAKAYEDRYWAHCASIKGKLYAIACEVMEQAIPTYSSAREVADAIHAVMGAIPDRRGLNRHVTITVRYDR